VNTVGPDAAEGATAEGCELTSSGLPPNLTPTDHRQQAIADDIVGKDTVSRKAMSG
jgi:hypothetical protein